MQNLALNNSKWIANPKVETFLSATGATIDGEIAELVDLISLEKEKLISRIYKRDQIKHSLQLHYISDAKFKKLSRREQKEWHEKNKTLNNQLKSAQNFVDTSSGLINKWETIDLPRLQALKVQFDKAKVDQTLANQGTSSEAIRLQAEARAEAERIAAKAKADSQIMVAKSTSDALDRSSKITRNIVVIVIVAAILISAYMFYKRRKK